MSERNYKNNLVTVLEAAIIIGKVISGKEDFIYEPPEGYGSSCIYTDSDGCPSCIIGCWIELAKIPGLERPEFGTFANARPIRTLSFMSDFLTKDAISFLDFVQLNQDSRMDWESSVKYAVSSMDSLNPVYGN